MKALRRTLARFTALFTRRRDERRLREEFEAHLALAIDDLVRDGHSPAEARRLARLRFGAVEAVKDAYRDQRLLPWLEALLADIVFGWRQLLKNRIATAAAVLSLGLAIGAATAAFRLVDAVMLRPLPVVDPDKLSALAITFIDRDGRPDYREDFDYPTFRRYRDAVKDHADLMVIGMSNRRQEAVFGNSVEPERVSRQFLSGNVFGVFGLRPAAGRLLGPDDDVKPGGHPVAVIGHDFWTRRFGRDPGAVGQTFLLDGVRYEIAGVAPEGFIGTEPGQVTDLFLPAAMNVEALNSPGWSWFLAWMRPRPGATAEQARQQIEAVFLHDQRERVKTFGLGMPKDAIEKALQQRVILLPAASGMSELQRQFRRPLMILSVLVGLVLLIACVNVANLLTAQSGARAREMALRVSIGAGRGRLVQLMLVQCALLTAAASAIGMGFAAWTTPLVTSMLRIPEDPVRIVFATGWREIAFGAGLALLVTLLFGLAPALRASAVQPVSALKGTDAVHARPRLMKGLIAAQVAFCVLVLFIAGLLYGTFDRLTNRPLGFRANGLLVLDVSMERKSEQAIESWMRGVVHLRQMPGVESVSLSSWPLLSRNRWTGSVRVPGGEFEPVSPYFLEVAPGFFETMGIALVSGRDFRPGDQQVRLDEASRPVGGVGVVNERFAQVYFRGANPVGKFVEVLVGKETVAPMQIIGVVRDAVYADVREPIRHAIYHPMMKRGHNAILVRTAGDPLAAAPSLRKETPLALPGTSVRTVQLQADFVRWQLLRERLLATLSLFFAGLAALLAAVGLYGVLSYSVMRQRREIGIRMALGARAAHVVWRVTAGVAAAALTGALVGLGGGIAAGRLVRSLLFEVKETDLDRILLPVAALAIMAIAAALPSAIRATRIDPAQTLRSE